MDEQNKQQPNTQQHSGGDAAPVIEEREVLNSPGAEPAQAGKLAKGDAIYHAAIAGTPVAMEPVPAYPVPVPVKKKRNVKKIVIIAAACLVAVLLVGNIVLTALRGPAPTFVQVQTVERGNISQSLNTTGLLSTGRRITVYSPVSAPLATAKPEVGSRVNRGELLFTYDTLDLERSYRTAAATYGAGAATAADTRNKSADNQQKVAQYEDNLHVYREERDRAKSIIASLEAELQKVTDEIKSLGGDLLPPAVSSAPSLAAGGGGGVSAPTPGAAAANPRLAELYEQQAALTQDIAVQRADLARMETFIGSADAGKEATEQMLLSPEANAALGLQQVPTEVSLEMAQDNLDKAQEGVRAPINGVITQVAAEVGSLAAQYAPLCIIESLDNVNVTVALSRYDLENVKVGQKVVVTSLGKEYAATVTKIDGMATQAVGATGTSNYVNATVALDAPDDNLHLGIEANVEIATGLAENVVKVPITAVNTDVNGTYCYVAENGVAVRREVTLGLSNDTDVEIISGLAAGDELILSSQSIIEGASITTDPAQAPPAMPTVNMPMGG